jgi:photosystem II stability/assembly factor-like uncharacterized protein
MKSWIVLAGALSSILGAGLLLSATGLPYNPLSLYGQQLNPYSNDSDPIKDPFVSTGDGTWVWQNPLPQGNTLHGVSCPTATTCFAVGGRSGYNFRVSTILATTDGGGKWSPQSSGTHYLLWGVSCPTATICFAVGPDGILATTDGGGIWYAQSFDGYLSGVSCPAATTCFAVGGYDILVTTDGGAAWNAQSSGTTNYLFDVSCPTSTTCFVVGTDGILATTDGGGTWNSQASGTNNFLRESAAPRPPLASRWVKVEPSWPPLTEAPPGTPSPPAPMKTLREVSCPTATNCFAVSGQYIYVAPVGGTILATTDGGSTWNPQSSGTNNYLSGVSCPTATTCFAVGGVTILALGVGEEPEEDDR